jgi:hypothetical protein
MPDDELRFNFFDPFAVPVLTGHELLRRDGVPIPSPGSVQPAQVRGHLWEVIYALAARRIFFSSTNHLSDEAFYEWLHGEWLSQFVRDFPPEEECNCHVDLLGSLVAPSAGATPAAALRGA